MNFYTNMVVLIFPKCLMLFNGIMSV